MEIPRRNFRKLSPEEMAKAAEAAAEITPDEELETPTTVVEETTPAPKKEALPEAPVVIHEKEEEPVLEEDLEPVEEVTFETATDSRDKDIPRSPVRNESSEDMEDLVFTAPAPKAPVKVEEKAENFSSEKGTSSKLPEASEEKIKENTFKHEGSEQAKNEPARPVASRYKAEGPIDLQLVDKILRAKEITDSISTDTRELMSSPEVKLIDSSLGTPAELIHALLSEETNKFTTFNTFNEIMNLDVTARPFKVLRLDEETSLSLLSLVESLSGSDPVEIKDEIDRAYRITSLIAGLDERAIKSVSKAMKVIEDIRSL